MWPALQWQLYPDVHFIAFCKFVLVTPVTINSFQRDSFKEIQNVYNLW